jgi:predicted phosphodiesterase
MKNFVPLSPQTIEQEIRRSHLATIFIIIVLLLLIVSIINIKTFWNYYLSKNTGRIQLVFFLGLFFYALAEPYFPRFFFYSLSINRSFNSLLIVHISDIHIQFPCFVVIENKLKKLFTKVNTYDPDFIFLTGDFISRFRTHSISKRNTLAVSRALSVLKAKQGVYAVLGNNDFCALNLLLKALSFTNITLLRDESIIVGNISITGIDSCETMIITKKKISSLRVQKVS